MKTLVTAHTLPDGTVEPTHVIEVVCANCQDPMSEQEVEAGACTNCGTPWQAAQSVVVTVTSMPAVQGLTISIG
jgi:uncharacterized CHY-type Zn-finger protein